VDQAYQAIDLLGAHPDYGNLLDEGEPPHKFYQKGFEALWQFGNFKDRLEGRNCLTIAAMILVLNWMMSDDYEELVPEGAVLPSVHTPDKESYDDFQRSLAVIEQYIQENKRSH
jgi:hypothetical protein